MLVLFAAAALALGAAAQQGQPLQPRPQNPIPYKQEDSLGSQLAEMAGALVLALGFGLGALYLWKRVSGVRPATDAARRLRVVETLRLGPRATLFLVELDGKPFIVGQHADRLIIVARDPVALATTAPAASPASPQQRTP